MNKNYTILRNKMFPKAKERSANKTVIMLNQCAGCQAEWPLIPGEAMHVNQSMLQRCHMIVCNKDRYIT